MNDCDANTQCTSTRSKQEIEIAKYLDEPTSSTRRSSCILETK